MEANLETISLKVQTQSISQSAVMAATLLVLLQVLDGVLTHIGLSLHGGGAVGEGNSFLRYAMCHYGIVPTLIIAKGLSVSLIFVLCSLSHKINWIENALNGLIALYIIFAIIPWLGILLAGAH